jgi:hypothetical protein
MAMDLMDTVRRVITPEASNRAAAAMGESADDTHRGFQGAVPTILAGLTERAATPGGASSMHDLLGESGSWGGAEKLAGGDAGAVEERGRSLIGKIFGDRSGSVSDALAQSSGVKSSSATRILAFATPLVLGVLGKEVTSRGVSAGGLSQLLTKHKKAIVDDPRTPSGLAGALGKRDLSELGETSTRGGGPAPSRAEEPSRFGREHEHEEVHAGPARRPRWGVILPALAIAGLAVWGITAVTRGHGPRTGVTAPQPTIPTMFSTPRPAPPNPPAGPAAPTTGISLPGGKTVNIPTSGPEADLAHTLADPSVPLPRTFRFDNVQFDPGSATPGPDASRSIDPVSMILQSYPSARVRINGLSESRSRAFKGMLVARGVSTDQIDAAGGAQTGIATSDSDRDLIRGAEIVLVSR